jgi:hypothetical protein
MRDEPRERNRPRQTNCQQEPSYPEHETVVFSLRFPDLTVHSKSKRCKIGEPHEIAICGEFGRTL